MSENVKPTIFSELEMVGDLKEYINKSSDVKISTDLKDMIFKQEDSVVLIVEKKIASPLEIISAKPYDDEVVKEIFTSFK
jgi:hypothetical protein